MKYVNDLNKLEKYLTDLKVKAIENECVNDKVVVQLIKLFVRRNTYILIKKRYSWLFTFYGLEYRIYLQEELKVKYMNMN